MKINRMRLSDICNRITSGGTPKTTIAAYYSGGNIPWLNTKEVDFCRIRKTEKYITTDGIINSSAKWIEKNSVVVAMYGATAGKVAIAKIPLTTNQACCNLEINSEIADYSFIYHYLKSKYSIISGLANGGAQQNLNVQIIKDFEIEIPPLNTQKQISSILDACDNKIEINTTINQNLDWEDYFSICHKIFELEKENQNLEAQAQAIFKSWFVDFEPFGGKMPKDWKVSQLRMLCETITKGTTPTTLKRAFVKKGINFFKAESISSNHTIDLKRIMFIDDETNAILKRSQIKPFDILYTIAGTIGRFAIVMPSQIPANTNQAVAIIRCKSIYTFFVYSIFLYEKNLQYFNSKIVQAVQANLSLGSIGDLPVILPSHDVLDRYSTFITPILDAIFKNNEESNRLAQLRDTLLPKLMSGEIDVSDVAV